jgi:hypothetical protein
MRRLKQQASDNDSYISRIQQQQNHKRAATRVWVPPRNKALKEATDNFPTSWF